MRGIVLCLLTAVASAGPLVAEEGSLVPEPLAGKGADITWEGPQFLQADQKGNVYLLDAADLRVYTIAGQGLGHPVQLHDASSQAAAPRGHIRGAAMSPDGRDWLLQLFPNGLQYFRSGEEHRLPETSWLISAVGLSGGRPVLAVGLGSTGMAGTTSKEDPPLLLGLSDLKWDTLASDAYEVAAVPGGGKGPRDSQFVNALQASRDFLLAAGPKGKLWLANRSFFRLRAYSPGGRLAAELKVGEDRIEFRKRSQDELETAKRNAKTAGSERDRSWMEYILSSPSPKTAIDSVTVASDGTVLLVTAASAQGGLQLDRFDPATGRLERTGLRLGAVKGRLQVAAGKDGLYFADTSGQGGRWFLAWETLEQAKWKRVFQTEDSAPPRASR